MPEPISTTSAGAALTLGGAAAAVPPLTVLGISLGLDPAVLLAGFAGALVAMSLLNTVPGAGDSWRDMLRTAWRRTGVALASSLTAGYLTPLAVLLVPAMPQSLQLGLAFVVGAGAQKVLAAVVQRVADKAAGRAAAPGGEGAAS